MKANTGLYLIYTLAGFAILSFAYAAYNGYLGEFQESVLLFGIGFIVLAQLMFAYRFFRYPDVGKGPSEARDEDVVQEAD